MFALQRLSSFVSNRIFCFLNSIFRNCTNIHFHSDSTNPSRKFAVKCVDTSGSLDQFRLFRKLRKEVILTRTACDVHIIKCFGMRYFNGTAQLFLQYAEGGDLWHMIGPDGMPMEKARDFFGQVLTGLEHIHRLGIVHRDIKPENFVIMGNGLLKIVDFGLATTFRYRGKELRLKTKCGTEKYLSPQVFEHRYRGEPTDIWASGISLIVMLCGEFPWSKAKFSVTESATYPYLYWAHKCRWKKIFPFKEFDEVTSDLLRKILEPNEDKRFRIEDIEQHYFFTQVLYQDTQRPDSKNETAASSSLRVAYQEDAPSPKSPFPNRTNTAEGTEIRNPTGNLHRQGAEQSKESARKKRKLSTASNFHDT